MSPRSSLLPFLFTAGLLAAAAPLCSCRKDAQGADSGKEPPPQTAQGKPRVAVSIFPLFDVARRIAGDRIDVVLVLPPGRTEHSYDPTPKEMQKLAGARLGVAVGLDLDSWLEKIVKGAAGDGVTFLELGPRAQPRPMGKEHIGEDEAQAASGAPDDDHHGANDPHFWLDPVRMAMTIDSMVDAYGVLSPKDRDAGYFKGRGAEVHKALGELHARIDARSKKWTRKSIVTFHGAFGYYASRYGLDVVAVIEPFPGKEPTAKYLAVVLDEIKKKKPAALFSEPQLDRRPAQVVADQSKLALYELDPIGGTSGADTYEKLIDADTDVLEKALK